MSPSRSQVEGLRSEALQSALATALTGNVTPLEDLLCRYGGGADPRPNFRLAAAFGAAAEGRSAVVTRLLTRFPAADAAPGRAVGRAPPGASGAAADRRGRRRRLFRR